MKNIMMGSDVETCGDHVDADKRKQIMEETGWLIEKDCVNWLALDGSRYVWTTDSNKALRFGRYQDAAKFMEYAGMTMSAYKITEHAWG